MVQIDWQPILWVGCLFLSIITALLGWIAVLIRADRNNIIVRISKNEETIIEQQNELKDQKKEIKEIAVNTHEAIEIVKVEQQHAKERLRIFEENFFNLKKKK